MFVLVVLVHRGLWYVNLLFRWCVDSLVFWCIGFGVLKYWYAGVLARWWVLAYRCIGVSAVCLSGSHST